ncbi:ArsR/SmtB family transcription factor [Halorientalis pallida]|uniref:ArsR family transcriptional regulator n=1 Tax=Halorientalis pallida TaxID=2479928 RepID=A0A498L4P1_9EURY|nr:helix-turn-helix domain-containing protein [Halorientalis pallida]RXK50217.1 ArsR family transcriptional regulator [Halorientalis pallida]
MSLLPSEPDTSAAEEAEPRVIGVDSEDADDVLSALTSETARSVLSELHDEPAPPAALAERVDTSLQNVQYHLNKLEDAGAIEVIDTIYSEKGREMNVYAPADRPLVIMAGGDDDDKSTLRSALSRFLGSLGIIGIASLAIQAAVGNGGFLTPTSSRESGGSGSGAAPPAGNDTGTATETPGAQYRSTEGDGGGMEIADVGGSNATETPVPDAPAPGTPESETVETATEAARTATETAASGTSDAVAGALSLPPGLLFFLGGVTALAVVAGVWYLTD